MKFEVDRDVFADALSKAAAIATAKESMPMLRSVLLRSMEATRIEVVATDLEISLWTSIDAKVEEPGAVCIPAKQSLDLVRGFIDSRITVDCGPDGRARMQCGRSKRSIPTTAPEDFPDTRLHADLAFTACDKAELLHAIAKTIHSVPRDSDAFSIAALMFLPNQNATCRAFASDGHRLTYQDLKGGFPLDVPATGIALPLKGLQQMLRMLDGEGEAFLADQENRIILKTDEGLLGMQLIEAEAPEYEAIIPDYRPFYAMVDAGQLQLRLSSMSPLASGKFRALGLTIGDGKLRLKVGSAETGEGEDEMDVEYDDEEFSVYLNYHYLKDVCKSAGEGKIRMEWVDRQHAVVFLEPKNPYCLHLIMPMLMCS